MQMRIGIRKTGLTAAAFGLVEIGALSRGVSCVRGSQVEICAEQDATLLGGTDAPTNNSLADPGIYAGTDGDDNPKRGLIEFDVAEAVPAGATITGVQLQLTVGQVAGSGGGGPGGTNGPETISLYDETQAWGQPTNFPGQSSFDGTGHGAAPDPGDATWNYSFYGTTPWTVAGGDWTSSLPDLADASVTGTLTSFTWSSAAMVTDVQNWLDNPTTNFGWIIKSADETDPRTFRAFWSAQGAAADDDPALAPELLVSYIGGGPANLTWNNAGGATPSDGQTWDISNNKNWSNSSSPNTVYTDGSNVTFNDANNATANGGTNANAYNVTLNTLVAPSSVTVNNSLGNYTISGTGTIGGTGSLTKSGTATLALSTPNTYSGGTTVTAGKLLIEPTSPTTSALPTGALSISGGVVQLADNVTAGTALAASNVVLTSLSITGNGTLDVGNNRIIIDYDSAATDPIASIAAWIHNGYYGLHGPSIISSDIATDDAASGYSYGIGYADGADNVVAGLPSGEIEIMFTLLGDANLDGTVNGEDFSPFSHNLGQSGTMWDDGDFNYDGTVNSEDFSPFAHNLGQTASLAAAAGVLDAANGISLASVPEPVGFSSIAVVAPILLCRRRTRRGR
jgi:autotransporter-associated beta strand protein